MDNPKLYCPKCGGYLYFSDRMGITVHECPKEEEEEKTETEK